MTRNQKLLDRGRVALIALAGIGLLITIMIAVIAFSLNEKLEHPERIKDPYRELGQDERLDRIEQDFLRAAEDNRNRKCPRPILRGEPVAGPAADDMRAVIEGEGDCFDAIERMSQHLVEANFSPSESRFDSFPPREMKTIRPPSDPEAEIEGLEETMALCEPIIDQLRTSTHHEDACSPYLPGVRVSPEYYLNLIRLTNLMIARARIDLEAGRWEEAVLPMLDIIRFGQDMHRGGTEILPAMVATATARMATTMLESILSDPREIPPKVLDRMESELANLIETEPHPWSFLQGINLFIAIYGLMPAYKGPDWIPPGGKSDDFPEAKEASLEEKIDLDLSRRLSLIYDMACPKSKTPYSCTRSLKKFVRKMETQHLLDKLAEDTEKEIGRELPGRGERLSRDLIRSTILSNRPFVPAHGRTRFRLGALLLATRYRSLSQNEGRPLEREAFLEPPLDALREDPFSGRPMKIEEISKGRFVLSPPVRIYVDDNKHSQPSIYLSCSNSQWGKDS